MLVIYYYSGLSYDHRFINKWMLTLKKPVWREKTRLTCSKVGAAVPFSPPTYYPSFSELWSSAFVKLNETDNMCVWCGLKAAFGGWFYDMILFILGITFRTKNALMNPSPARSGGWWRSGNGHFPPACQERKKLSILFHFLSYSSPCFRICCLP